MALLTVKAISTVERIGSTESTSRRLDNMSKAAGKFNAMLGVSIRKKLPSDSKEAEPNGSNPRARKSTSSEDNVHVETFQLECSRAEAALIANHIFDMMNRTDNSEKYTEKKAYFDSCKMKTLAKLGASDYSDLTNDQRIMYAKEMSALKAPFLYTKKIVHIKYGDNQTLYSRSNRRLGVVHYTSDAFNLKAILDKESKTKTVVFRPISGPAQQTSSTGNNGNAVRYSQTASQGVSQQATPVGNSASVPNNSSGAVLGGSQGSLNENLDLFSGN